MNAITQDTTMIAFDGFVAAALTSPVANPSEIYERNRHRVYSLAFWMTDHELAAEEVLTDTFCRAFGRNAAPTAEDIDHALISVLRQYMSLGKLSLDCAPADKVLSVRRNTLRVDLERAVVQLPNTERMIFLMHDVERYDHARIARLLDINEVESMTGLHQARLRVRELLAK